MEAVSALSAVAEDRVVVHPADDVFHGCADLAAGGVVVFLARQQGLVGASALHGRRPSLRCPER
jgi:hypothetical protein